MVSRGLSTMDKETEMRKGAKTPAAYFMMTKRMEILVTSMRNWLMGHAFCILYLSAFLLLNTIAVSILFVYPFYDILDKNLSFIWNKSCFIRFWDRHFKYYLL